MPHLDGTDDGVGYGVRGESSAPGGEGVVAVSTNGGNGLSARSTIQTAGQFPGCAGKFEGIVHVINSQLYVDDSEALFESTNYQCTIGPSTASDATLASGSRTAAAIVGASEVFDAIVGNSNSDAHAGVTGRNLTTGANGGVGIYGTGGQFGGKFDGAKIGAFATGSSAQGGIGVQGTAFTGVVGLAGGLTLQGMNPGAGVFGAGPSGVWGQGTNRGVTGSSPQLAVFGETTGSDGNGTSGIGVSGYGSMHGVGVHGQVGATGSTNTTGIAILGQAVGTGGGLAGKFEGNVDVVGTLTKQAGGFRIDHPLDPENRALQHSFVESPDMMNIYNGIVMLDAVGEATVNLPDWFEALNGDFRYQLTCIGSFAPVYIVEEIHERRFKIAGGNPRMKISWQVTGIRHDPYAEMHRIVTEVAKPTQRLGHPVLADAA